MFTLQRTGRVRVFASAGLEAGDFRSIAHDLGVVPLRARKIGFVAGRQLENRQRIETRWNGKESEITGEPGDWMVTSLSPAREVLRDAEAHVNTYAIRPTRFGELYEPCAGQTEFGAVFRAKGLVEAIYLSGGFEIKAPWGEMQRADDGYLLLNGNEVYGNHRDTFEATYEVVH
jgi:hypothetical protein